tara:strand:- start:28 stop:447 length:420 start_codon:yes stop_codon:yes gene_type:complete
MHKTKYKIEDYKLRYNLETRFRDLDSFGHVNNAVYASYIESARVSLLNNWNIPRTNRGKSIIMASLKIDYHAQLEHPSSLILGQKIVRLGRTSFDIETVVFDSQDNRVICSALVVIVCFDFDLQLPVELYDSIKNAYEG